MAKAVKHLLNLSQGEALQEYIDAFDKRERDRISAENLARREGRLEGQQKGIEKGIKKGRQEDKKVEKKGLRKNLEKSL